jgi:hypothetical protein
LLNNVDNTSDVSKTYKYSYIRCLVVKEDLLNKRYRCKFLSNDESIHQRATKRILMLPAASIVDASLTEKEEAETSWR